ncbi:MAG: ISL3 family transposase [Candidatus Marinimicrobia bacterium]|nr:ISL3 family transposase [Bacteroidota bacterium]MBT4359523.1 ISL3 family transposase [Candidatus Neomarinimicrobiota bacterium]MBT4412385.1 ISL3 family transposase [Bacteroidota bacterium]MBT7464439.1 ISL3 family transposase [Bacteroidota bacterium]
MRLSQLIDLPQLKIIQVDFQQNELSIYASSRTKGSRCPACGRLNYSIHDRYYRTVKDLPVFQNSTTIQLRTRKFKCKNQKCDRKVFSEQISHVIRYSRRTVRVSKLLDRLSIELTGKQGSRMAALLFLKVSASTLTRIALKQPLPEIKQPRVLGVDDWAFRKGVNYGTILIDMETSRPIDLLPSRDGQVLKNWLLKYNDVKIVTRDRASSYASAVIEACPNAVQIADRFHLLMNLSDALDAYFKSIRKKIRSLITAKTIELLEVPENISISIKVKKEDVQSATSVHESIAIKNDPRLDIFLKVKELQAKGTPIRRIATDLKMSRNTIRSYFNQESLSPRKGSKSTNIEVFTDLIVARLNENGYKLMDIFREIKKLGYTGGRSQGCENIKLIKENYKIETNGYSEIPLPKIPYIKPLSTRNLAKYIGFNLTDITDHHEQFYLQTLLDNITELRIVRKLVRIFKTMLARGCGNIRRWIDFVTHSKYKLAGLKSFARGLLRDIKAVENGINMSWSNGAVEGHVNRIKSIKRQMYGRASFELLRKKVILSQSG